MDRSLLVCGSLAACLGLGVAVLLAATNTHDQAAAVARPAAQGSAAGPVGLLPENGPSENDYPDLHNLMQVTGRIYSGAEPKTEEAFRQLAHLGVKVVLSVDSARPNLDLAKKYGLRYVHIPIGYDGLDEQAVRAFTKAADELDEPIYVHCHHGKHRGPAGAAAICVASGKADGLLALKILEQAGTSKGYAGLWRDVQNFQRPAPGEALPELLPVAEVGSLSAAMAQIDRATDNLKLSETAGWQAPANHPDISPAQEALLLKEGFRETVRQLEQDNDFGEEFLAWMEQSEHAASQLQAALEAGDAVNAQSSFAVLREQCQRCHASYRDLVPRNRF